MPFIPCHFIPRFTPFVLSFFGLFGADLVTTARWIDIILFGLTILLLGVTIYAYTKSSWLSIIASFLFFCMPVVVDVFSGAMSEPLFLFTGLASLCLILLFLKNNRLSYCLLPALASGLGDAYTLFRTGIHFHWYIGILLDFQPQIMEKTD